MIALQRFKENDAMEGKFIAVAMPILELLGEDRNQFFTEAFNCFLLGDILYELDRDPMAGVITQEIFRESFPAIHQLFSRPGTFEFYLTVFRSIWGPEVVVQFTVPSPGVLHIEIQAVDIAEFTFLLREIVNDEYVYSDLIDESGNLILAQDKVGTKSQAEVDALINELSPYGIFITANLT